jgi:pilus assembly protein CpaD
MSTQMKQAKAPASGFVIEVGSGIRRPGAKALALVLMAPLCACGVNRTLPPPIVTSDYHDRHPVVLADAPHMIDVFPPAMGRRLDSETAGRIRDFVSRYHRFGHGQVTVLAPVGGPSAEAARVGVGEVRRALATAGARGNIFVGTYPVSDPSLAAPIRMSFQSIKAKVAGRCGEWPADLASGSSMEGWENKTYWNFGCASQSTLSAQVADPRDLVTPRGESASDVEMRMRAIGRVRRGEDPITDWHTKATSISKVGGSQ